MAKYIVKREGNVLYPAPEYQEALEKNVRSEWVECEIKHKRNVKFHRKFFAMINLGFNNWEPRNLEAAGKLGLSVIKSPERFRKDVTIAAGYYTPIFGLDGEVKLEADSISFGNMGQDEFEELYSACAQVLLDLVFEKKITREELDKQVDELLSF